MLIGNVLEVPTRGLVGAGARGSNRKRKRNKKKPDQKDVIQQQVFARCVSQVPACEALASDSCGNNAACAAALRICCQSLTTCEFSAFFTCANEALSAGT